MNPRDMTLAFAGALAGIVLGVGAMLGLGTPDNNKAPPPIIITDVEATATAVAAPIPGVGCPEGWKTLNGGWQPREDDRSYLACDFKGPVEQWNLALVNDGSKVLTRYVGGPLVQYVQLADGTGDNVDAILPTIR